VISKQQSFRFSGHDTFHCKEQWLLKGLQLVDSHGDVSVFRKNEAIPKLGVGKNMVRSILHWLKAFGLLNNDNEISDFAQILFLENRIDPFLEKDGSLWLLQYYLCKVNHSSIYNLIFSKFFEDKATLEFSEYQIKNFINRTLSSIDSKEVTEKTFNSDFKVFLRTYVYPVKNEKTVEDDFSAPLLSLNLIADTGRRNEANQSIYRLNKGGQDSIATEIFAYCILNEFDKETAIDFDDIRKTVGAYLCLSNEGLESLIYKLCDFHEDFVYKDDAGVRQLQVKNNNDDFKLEILRSHYGV
jgi:hypothetical protein